MRHIAKFIIAVFLLLAPFVVAGVMWLILLHGVGIVPCDFALGSAAFCGACLVANGLYAVHRKKTQFPKLYITSWILLTLSIGSLCTVTLFFPLLLTFACCLVSLFITLFFVIQEARNNICDVYTGIIFTCPTIMGWIYMSLCLYRRRDSRHVLNCVKIAEDVKERGTKAAM
jgi:hypothetical protein